MLPLGQVLAPAKPELSAYSMVASTPVISPSSFTFRLVGAAGPLAFFTALDVVSDRMPTTFSAVTVTFMYLPMSAAVMMYSLSLPMRAAPVPLPSLQRYHL